MGRDNAFHESNGEVVKTTEYKAFTPFESVRSFRCMGDNLKSLQQLVRARRKDQSQHEKSIELGRAFSRAS